MFKIAKSFFDTCCTGIRIFAISLKRSIAQEIEESRQLAKMRYSEVQEDEKSAVPEVDKIMKISLEEAMKILDVEVLDRKKVEERYRFLFEGNEKLKGGSFYILSKIVRARERIDHELGGKEPEGKE